MISRRQFPVLAAGGLLAPYLRAADWWERTSYSDWDAKEIQKMLTNSPWAQPYTLQMMPPGGGGGFGEGGGGRGGRGGGGGGGGRGRRGGGGGDLSGGGPPPLLLTVRWYSAMPIKQANVMAQFGEGEIPAEAQNYLDREEPNYIVSVSGLPQRMGRMAQNTDRLKQGAALERKGKPPIAPEGVEVQLEEATQKVAIFFLFPKSDPITLDDQQVEFVMQLGPNKIKKKFSLKKMMYGGALAV